MEYSFLIIDVFFLLEDDCKKRYWFKCLRVINNKEYILINFDGKLSYEK